MLKEKSFQQWPHSGIPICIIIILWSIKNLQKTKIYIFQLLKKADLYAIITKYNTYRLLRIILIKNLKIFPRFHATNTVCGVTITITDFLCKGVKAMGKFNTG
jgi:hypothetical protein